MLSGRGLCVLPSVVFINGCDPETSEMGRSRLTTAVEPYKLFRWPRDVGLSGNNLFCCLLDVSRAADVYLRNNFWTGTCFEVIRFFVLYL